MTRTWPTSGFEKRPLANSLDTAYPRTEAMEKPYLDPDVIRIIKQMYASEADRVISTVKTLPQDIQRITIRTIGDYYWALAANDSTMWKSIDLLKRAA